MTLIIKATDRVDEAVAPKAGVGADLRNSAGAATYKSFTDWYGQRSPEDQTLASLLSAATLVLFGAVAAWHRSPDRVGGEPSPAPRARIAVLPFDNHSPEANADYLGDALSQALITGLARHGDFHVLSWRTARQYRSVAMSTLAQELGLGAVLELPGLPGAGFPGPRLPGVARPLPHRYRALRRGTGTMAADRRA